MDFSRFTRFFLIMGASDLLPFTRSCQGRTQFLLLWVGYFLKHILLIGSPTYFNQILLSWFAVIPLTIQTVLRFTPRHRALLDDTPDWFPGGPVTRRIGRLGTTFLLFTEPAIALIAMFIVTQGELAPSFYPPYSPMIDETTFNVLAKLGPLTYIPELLATYPMRYLGLATAFFGPACLLFNNVAEYIDLCRGNTSHHPVNTTPGLSFPTAG